MGGSGTIFAVIIAVSDSNDGRSVIPLALIAIGTFVSLIIANSVWRPNLAGIPGTTDIDDLSEHYINASVENAYNNFIADEITCFENDLSQNSFIARRLTSIIVVLDLQIVVALYLAVCLK